MKKLSRYLSVIIGMMLLQGCDSGDSTTDPVKDSDPATSNTNDTQNKAAHDGKPGAADPLQLAQLFVATYNSDDKEGFRNLWATREHLQELFKVLDLPEDQQKDFLPEFHEALEKAVQSRVDSMSSAPKYEFEITAAKPVLQMSTGEWYEALKVIVIFDEDGAQSDTLFPGVFKLEDRWFFFEPL